MSEMSETEQTVTLEPCWCRSKTDSLSVRANMAHGDFACRERGRYVFCSNCWAHGPTYNSEAEASKGWNRSRASVVAPQGDAIHWQLKAGVAETMCGVAIEAEEGIRVTLLSDMATCKACDAAAWGYKCGRADAATAVTAPVSTGEREASNLTDEQITQFVMDMQSRLDACAQTGQAYRVRWRDVKSTVAIIRTLQARLAEADNFNNNVVEREAACCPEDVGFDEYIRALEKALEPFAAVCTEGGDPNEAVLVANGNFLLNRHLARAAQLAPNSRKAEPNAA